LIGEQHIVGRQPVAVVEGDALAQLELVLGAVVRDRPALGQVALRHQLGIDMHQAGQHVRGDLELQHLVDLGGIERADLAHAGPAAGQRAALGRGRSGAAEAGNEVPDGERAGGRHQPQHGAALQHRPRMVVAVQPEQRIARIEIIGIGELGANAGIVHVAQCFARLQRHGSLLGQIPLGTTFPCVLVSIRKYSPPLAGGGRGRGFAPAGA
jgi:hypothetical protein